MATTASDTLHAARCTGHAPVQRPGGHCASCRIRHLALCAALPQEALAPMAAVSSELHLAPGSTLVSEGDPRTAVYTVTAGALRLVRLLPDGRRRVADFRMPGDFIGLSNAPRHRHDIEAVTESAVCRVRVEDMAALRARQPALDRRLLSMAMQELDHARDDALCLSRLDPVERLAAFLVALAGKRRRWNADPRVIVLPMGRSDIADHLGLTVETVSRSFSRLRRDGAIALPDAQTVEVLDRPALDALAAGVEPARCGPPRP